MKKEWGFIWGLLSFAFLGAASAATVKCFFSPKDWQVCVDVNDFEPQNSVGDKTILDGSSKGLKITILADKSIDGTSDTDRNVYGKKYAENFGIQDSVEMFDCGPIRCIAYQWKNSGLESPLRNRCGCHGYAVKDNISFDIHISANSSEYSKARIMTIIKSFEIQPTAEIRDFNVLHEAVYKPFDNKIDRQIQEKERVKKVEQFLEKYPDNPEAYVILADHHLANNRHEKAIPYYTSALKYRSSNLFLSPASLWCCYDGLGLCYAMTGNIPHSKSYFISGYNVAKETQQKEHLASSAYNLACYYGETEDVQKCVRFLSEAIRISENYRQQAVADSSFAKVKNTSQFIKLLRMQ